MLSSHRFRSRYSFGTYDNRVLAARLHDRTNVRFSPPPVLHNLTDSLSFADITTEVVYARIPAALKEAVEAYAAAKGVTQTTAVADLLERGLEAVSNAASIAELEKKLAAARLELSRANVKISSLEERERNLLSTYQGLAQRIEQTVGTCPNCRKPVRGYDLLAAGRCQYCKSGLSSLLADTHTKTGLNQTEFLLLIGAIGLLLSVAYLQSKSGS